MIQTLRHIIHPSAPINRRVLVGGAILGLIVVAEAAVAYAHILV